MKICDVCKKETPWLGYLAGTGGICVCKKCLPLALEKMKEGDA